MKTVTHFNTINGVSATTSVFVNIEIEPLPFLAAPPHAGYAPVLAHLNRGMNYHGSLHETLYACTDNDAFASRIVLWLGDTGSQQEDDIGRLIPVAWIDISDQEEQADEDTWSFIYHPPLLGALLTAMLAQWIQAGWLEPEPCIEAGDVLDQAMCDECWSTARKIAQRG